MILIAVAILSCLIAGLWMYARWNYGVFEKMGVPIVPYTNPILGSTREMYSRPAGLLDVEWMRKYGQVFGVYEGRTPTLYVCAPELIRLMCVKDSEYFNGKREFDFGDPVLNEMPDFLPYEKWKTVRSMTTPAFSSAKIKMMNLPMREATLSFVSDIKEQIKKGNGTYEDCAIDRVVHTMLTDLISRAFFSIQLDDRTKENEFAKIVSDTLLPFMNESWLKQEYVILSHTFPFLKKLFPTSIFDPKQVQRFVQVFKGMLEARKKSGQKYNDVIDLCLDWYSKLDTPEWKRLEITELTLICQAMVFFAAAQDQVSTMVAAVIYNMVKDPELEKKIYDEIDTAFNKHNGKIDHENLSELHVLQASVSESLRLYSVFHRTERLCTKDWKNEEYNLDIKKGMVIVIPLWAINRGDYHDNPDEFDYTRFMPENKDKVNPFSSSAFGHGPRACPGKRFAHETIPLVLAYMLRHLKFKARKNTAMDYIPGGFLMSPHLPVHVDVEERKHIKLMAPSF